MGPPLDHHRHLPRRARARSRAHHGRALSLLPARGQPRRPAQRRRGHATARRPALPLTTDIRQGFVYERVPHITLKSIANNAEIDVIWETYQATLEPLREALNKALNKTWEEWQIPREARRFTGRSRPKTCTPSGGSGASRARRRSTLPSPPKPNPNISTTNRTKTTAKSAWRGRSPSKAFRRTASWASMRTTS